MSWTYLEHHGQLQHALDRVPGLLDGPLDVLDLIHSASHWSGITSHGLQLVHQRLADIALPGASRQEGQTPCAVLDHPCSDGPSETARATDEQVRSPGVELDDAFARLDFHHGRTLSSRLLVPHLRHGDDHFANVVPVLQVPERLSDVVGIEGGVPKRFEQPFFVVLEELGHHPAHSTSALSFISKLIGQLTPASSPVGAWSTDSDQHHDNSDYPRTVACPTCPVPAGPSSQSQ
jgi:hypothetical protein